MARDRARPTGRESPFQDTEIIVSKTDLTGRLIYANTVFQRVSHFTAKELIGQPHSIIRHPDMPRAVFKLLWDTIEAKRELFAYILNLASNGDHYWVLAHVTPSFDAGGKVVGYHSNRRKPDADKLAKVVPLYKMLLEEERRGEDRKAGMRRASDRLMAELRNRGLEYDEFVLSL
ncbi:MAG TPA: PAS domain-containing protein [Stellaceae bacterium]|nr:PAS domain-containing protein [Stellaceae bacterium]